MPLPATEALHPDANGLDTLSDREALDRLLRGQEAALAAVRGALPDIAAGAAVMAEAIARGRRLVYGGAGSSALMAMADAMELPGTYGISPENLLVLMAGGMPGAPHLPGHVEDDTAEAQRAARLIRDGDALVAVSASGSTPYTVSLAQAARARGARVIALANNAGAPLLEGAEVAIHVTTPPELIAGSTRMGAGTAQKAALNLMSTLMAVRLGHVHDGMMVNVVADNEKLRARAIRIVASIGDVSEDAAEKALQRADGAVKPAALIACGATPDQAGALLSETGQNLRAALARLRHPA